MRSQPYSMDPRAAAILAKTRKKHGDETIMLGSEIKNAIIPRITTGSLAVDVSLGGGWAANKWNEIIGAPSNGKTALALKTVAANQAANKNFFTVWFASEEFVPTYAEMLGCDLDRIAVVDDNTMEVVFQTSIDFLEERAADMIVIDSLPALVSMREEEGSMEDLQPGQAAFLTGKFFRKSAPAIKRSLLNEDRFCTGLVINQWRNKIGVTKGDPRVTPGGLGKDFYYFIRVDVRRTEWIMNTRTKRIGQTIEVRNLKNKTAPPGAVGQVDFYFDFGNGHEAGSFDVVKDVLNVAMDPVFGVIQRGGSTYTFKDHKWVGKERLVEGVRDDPALLEQISHEVMTMVTHRPDSVVESGPEPEDVVNGAEQHPLTRRARKKD